MNLLAKVHDDAVPIKGGIPGKGGCEWDPDRKAPALADSTHHLTIQAVLAVDAGEDGHWKVCNRCAWRAPFKTLPKVRIPRSQR